MFIQATHLPYESYKADLADLWYGNGGSIRSDLWWDRLNLCIIKHGVDDRSVVQFHLRAQQSTINHSTGKDFVRSAAELIHVDLEA